MNEEVGIRVLTQMVLLKVLGTWYLVLCTMKSCYLILFLISNDELRSKNEEVGICGLTQMALLKLLGTWYFVLCTMKSCYLILFLISNAERRSKNEEVGICVLTQMALLKLLRTWYGACLPQAGTLYNVTLSLASKKKTTYS